MCIFNCKNSATKEHGSLIKIGFPAGYCPAKDGQKIIWKEEQVSILFYFYFTFIFLFCAHLIYLHSLNMRLSMP